MKKKLLLISALFIAFTGNKLFAEDINAIQDAIKAKGAKWVAGETSASNLPQEEKLRLVGLNFQPIKAPPITDLDSVKANLPKSIDWRNYEGHSYVSPVRNQGKCGSCWAFALTAGLESYVMKNEGAQDKDVDLSEQVMISCSGVGSCDGGTLNASFIQETGLPPESFYPYTATNGSCSSAKEGWKDNTYTIGSWGSVSQNLSSMKAALVKYGPIPTAMMVYEDFMSYKSGIYSHVSGKKLGGHGVFLVGYNDDEQYFIVKNSWGPKWGEDGFFRIAYSEIESDTNFGLATVAYKPAAAKFKEKEADVNVKIGEGDKALTPILNPVFEGN